MKQSSLHKKKFLLVWFWEKNKDVEYYLRILYICKKIFIISTVLINKLQLNANMERLTMFETHS